MVKIAITGLTGVIGEVLSEELANGSRIIDLYHNIQDKGNRRIAEHQYIDLSKKRNVVRVLDKVKPDVIVHMAAVTHIDICEEDRKNGKEGMVWRVNVEGTREIAKFAAENKIHLIFLSTECVFDGSQEYFGERAKKNPINWYGLTKSVAEDIILDSGAPATIIRSVVAYHKNDDSKTIYGKILKQLKTKGKIYAVEDQLFTPTYTYDIVKAIKKSIEKKLRGVLHVAPKKNISPYDFALLIAGKNKFSTNTVKKISLNKMYGTERAALRLKNSSLEGHKSIQRLKFVPRSPRLVLPKARRVHDGK